MGIVVYFYIHRGENNMEMDSEHRVLPILGIEEIKKTCQLQLYCK